MIIDEAEAVAEFWAPASTEHPDPRMHLTIRDMRRYLTISRSRALVTISGAQA